MSFRRSIVLLLLGWVTATAQQPAEAPPGTVTPAAAVPAPLVVLIPGAIPPPAAGVPAAKPAANVPAPKPGIPLGENKIEDDIIEPKLTGKDLAGLYRRYTGRRVIPTAAAATAEMAFIQEASPQDPLTYAEAAELLRKAAVLECFVFVQHPQTPNLDILTHRPDRRGGR